VADLQILLEQGQHVWIARIVFLRRNARRFDDDEQMVILEQDGDRWALRNVMLS
jgi:hypothetical protein